MGLARGPRPAPRRAHARRPLREARRPSPRFLSQNHPPVGRRHVPGDPSHIARGRRRAAAPSPDRLSRSGPRLGWSRMPPLAALRGWGRAILSPQHLGGAGTVLIKPPPLPNTMRLGPGSRQGGRGGPQGDHGGAAKRGSSLEQQDPGSGEGMGSGTARVEERGSCRKPRSRPPSPTVGPSRHRFLPRISFPAAARGKIRAAPAAP